MQYSGDGGDRWSRWRPPGERGDGGGGPHGPTWSEQQTEQDGGDRPRRLWWWRWWERRRRRRCGRRGGDGGVPPIGGGKEGGLGARAKVRVAHTRAHTAMGAMGAGEGRGVDAAGAVGRSTINVSASASSRTSGGDNKEDNGGLVVDTSQ
ncbi:hypothetical protein NHX12_017188, partial [Muraenolepis orangiensis]